MHAAFFKICFNDKKLLETVSSSISPDNYFTPSHMHISSFIEDSLLNIIIYCNNNLGSLLNTVDDLILSIYIALESIKSLQQTYK